MPKFSSIVAGPRARKRVVLPLPGAACDGETGKWDGPTVDVDVRTVRADEHDKVLASARRYAIENGVAEPSDGDELFERGRILHTLAIACVDVDSPVDAPAPFFDGGVEQILSSESLTPEVLAYLYEQQAIFQDESSPLMKTQSPVEFTAALMATAEGDMSFFVYSRPGLRWSFTHTMAKLLAESMKRASRSSSDSSSEPLPSTTRG